jgi:hypothetical protein
MKETAMPFYPSWAVYIDDAAKGKATEPMSKVDAKWAIEDISEMATDRREALMKVEAQERSPEEVRRMAADIITEHIQVESHSPHGVANPCACGWGVWGAMHSDHVVAKLVEAGLLP